MLKSTIVSEQMKQKLEDVITDIFVSEKEVVEEGNSGTPVAPKSIIRSKDRAHLITLYKRIKGQIESDNVKVKFMRRPY